MFFHNYLLHSTIRVKYSDNIGGKNEGK
jgi:hypothetical protein